MLPSKEEIRKKLEDGVESARQFEKHPPKWAYWVFGIAIIILMFGIRHL